MLWRLQGVDWRDKKNWGCNAGMNPYLEYTNDGVSLVSGLARPIGSVSLSCAESPQPVCSFTWDQSTELFQRGTTSPEPPYLSFLYRTRWRWCSSR